MAVYISLTTDLFQERFKKTVKAERALRRGAGSLTARRPLRGLEVKEPTHAMIRVIQSNGREVELVDSNVGEGRSGQTTNFLLQAVQIARMEKHQIVETFGEAYIFFFGEAPMFVDVSAMLINSLDFNWRAEWFYNYQNAFRGSRLAELGARLYLFYDDTILEGYLLQCQVSDSSDNPMAVPLQFRMFVTNHENISNVEDGAYPIRGSVQLPGGVDLTQTPSIYDIERIVKDNAGIGGSTSGNTFFYTGTVERTQPIRTNIEDNIDEFTYEGKPAGVGYTSETIGAINDLQQAAIRAIQPHGGNLNNPKALASLGLSASFSAGASAGVSVGAFAGAGASAGGFGASASASAYARAFAGVGDTRAFAKSSAQAGASYGNYGSGASTYVGGKPSAFGMVSCPGQYSPTPVQPQVKDNGAYVFEEHKSYNLNELLE